MLEHEQKVREFLDGVYQRKNASALSIPNFLPPKMKEVLGELGMVESEISRLETQITQLQAEVKKEKEAKMEAANKAKEEARMKPLWHHISSSLTPNNNNPPSSNNLHTKLPFDTKALHFISKAIKGDYGIKNFSSVNETSLSPSLQKGTQLDSKENHHQFHEEVIRTFGERVPRKSGFIKPASPLREPRQPTPRRERNVEMSMDMSHKFMSTSWLSEPAPKVMPSPMHSSEEAIQRWPPNKLSESIMKCLVYIYVRLLRTSRAMEIEKSGTIARSNNFSLSFRSEPSLNVKTSLIAMHKQSRQQDPYGIFDSENSVPRDIGPYKNLVRFSSTSMDTKCLSTSSSVPLFQKLKVLMNNLEKVDLRFLTHQQKLAFWINMYNACIMHGFLQYGAPSSSTPEKLASLINKATLNIGGHTINAQGIEHYILRKPLEKEGKQDEKGSTIPSLYCIGSLEPNITFALCCGTRSSPAVKIYTAEGVAAELEKSKLEYLQASIIVTNTKKIALPELLLRNMRDFAQDLDSLLDWVCQQLPTSGSLRKSIVDCFRGIHGGAKPSAIVEKIPYEFEFQYLLSV
nr:Rho-associated protein kinase [Ipomoea batatas]